MFGNDLDVWQFVAIAFIGMAAGVLGGMLGVGGSVVMIPGLTLLLCPNQHVYQAAAMIANVAVSVPAALRHRKAQTVVPQVIKWLLPAALVMVVVGVYLSNLAIFQGQEHERRLRRVFAAFLAYVIVMNIRQLRSSQSADGLEQARLTPGRCGAVGGVMGTVAGLLGIGGGAIAVPLQQVLLKLPLRQCIANSATVICITAAVGAAYKNATLPQADAWHTSVGLAVMLGPTAWIGGRLGASLTHRLPLRQVRIVFICLMVVAAFRMADISIGLG